MHVCAAVGHVRGTPSSAQHSSTVLGLSLFPCSALHILQQFTWLENLLEPTETSLTVGF